MFIEHKASMQIFRSSLFIYFLALFWWVVDGGVYLDISPLFFFSLALVSAIRGVSPEICASTSTDQRSELVISRSGAVHCHNYFSLAAGSAI